MRICGDDGAIWGAGMLLGEEYVLTCAHVVMEASRSSPVLPGSAPDADVWVDFVGMPNTPRAKARVVPSCWAPMLGDKRGDVALLRMDRVIPDAVSAPLRRLPASHDRVVRVFGFAEPHDDGVWVDAKLKGEGGPGGEWVQLNSEPQGERVRTGFSGAGVIDKITKSVLGMVVTEYTEAAAGLSWMLPVGTIVRYARLVDQWVSGDKAVDESLTRNLSLDTERSDVDRRLTSWLVKREPGDTIVIIVGEHDAAAMRRTLLFTDRERRPAAEVVARAPDGTVPPVGSIAVAVDASGKTADEVSRRISGRIGLPIDEPTTPIGQPQSVPVTVALAGIDDADQPEAVLTDVVKPLLDRGARVLLHFNRETSPSVHFAKSLLLGDPEPLRRLVDAVGTAEEDARRRHRQVAGLVAPVPKVPVHAPMLRLRLTGLRTAKLEVDADRLLGTLAACERAADRALREIEGIQDELDAAAARYQELRGLLRSYNAMATDHGRREDEELAGLYRPATEAIAARPCWLPLAEEAVDRYVRAVRRRIGGPAGVGA